MAAKKKGLGRGLTALLGNSDVESMIEPKSANELRNIDLDLIERGPWQPREHFDEESLQELADSIKTQGVVQPIVVRQKADGRFEIVAGERRWRASQKAGLSQIPVVVKTFNDQTAAAVSLIENIQRENLNPLEESTALKRLIDEFDMTHQQVAETVARSRATVSNLLRLQDLNPDVKMLLAMRDIEMGHARALLAIDGMEQSSIAKDVARKGLSVRETEALIRKISAPTKAVKPPRKDPDIVKLEERLTECLGAPVIIKPKARGKGSLEIAYSSLDVLDGILSKIES
ncbi:MAG: ParB/RepB/Spo0J family partition protein [Gammaproteobacteria bacterium]|nr:ParB/RepB/Spo0J family partition protein [Gammaproteobacteria bacterium]